MQNLFNIDMSLGAACNIIERVNNSLEPVTEKIKQKLKDGDNINIDETGWRSNGVRRWLWTFVTSLFVFFQISPSRGAKVLKSVLGESFEGVITSDDHSAYNAYHKNGIRQLCWAHLIRKLKGLKDSRSSPHAYMFARNMLKEAGHMFSYWHAFREGFFSRKRIAGFMKMIRTSLSHTSKKNAQALGPPFYIHGI
jgi:transposase-like protein